MLGEDKKVDAALMQSDQDLQTVTQKDNKKRNTIIGVSSALAVVATLLTTSAATGGLTKPDADAKKVEGFSLLQEPAAQPPSGLELGACRPKSLPVETIQQTCDFSLARFLKGQELDINSEEFACTVGSDGLYSDPTFPATIEGMMYWSKYQGETQMAYNIAQYKEKYGWDFARPTQIPAKKGGGPNPSLWGEKGALPMGVVQGMVGDCWFLAAASAVAATPSRIHSVFENKSYPKNGAFQINFHIDGKRQKVIIDDRLPAIKLFANYIPNKLFGSTASPQGAWWSVILEKAAAKLFKNYDGITGGDPADALRVLTGMPTISHHQKELRAMGDDQLWKIIMQATKNNWPMTTGTNRTPPSYLFDSHAYTVLGGLQLTNADGSDGPKLVKIRNPHGQAKYNKEGGPWGFKSHRWTKSYLEQTGFTETIAAAQGEFWFPLERFAQDWDFLAVAHYIEDFIESRMAPSVYTPINQADLPKKPIIRQNVINYLNKQAQKSYYTISNPVVQDVYITCEQFYGRMFPKQATCLEKPNSHNFSFYKKFSPLDQRENEYYDDKVKYEWCNRNAQVIENMPVGDFIVSVDTGGGSENEQQKKNSFELVVKAGKEKVTVARKEYDMLALQEVDYCRQISDYCTPKICDLKEFQHITKENCKSTYCKADVKDCTYEVCHSDSNQYMIDYCGWSYQQDHPSAIQFLRPDDVAACKANVSSCTKLICDNEELSKTDTCQAFNGTGGTKKDKEAEKKDKEDKKKDDKKDDSEFHGVGHWMLLSSYNKQKRYCLQLDGDKVGQSDVTKHFVNDTSFLESTKLMKGDCASVDWGKKYMLWSNYEGVSGTFYEYKKSTAADKKKAEKDAEKREAEKRAKEAEKIKKEKEAKAWDQFHGEAHFIQNNYCIQLSGKLAGEDENYKSLYKKITDISPQPPLEKDDCSEIGYSKKVGTFSMTVDGVDASIYLRPREHSHDEGQY